MENKEEKKRGRPTDFKEEYVEQVYKLCLLGATDKFLADFFDVTETTINNWKISHPSFFESLKHGKMLADMEVAKSLYDSCFDRQIPEKTAFKVKNVFYNEAGKRIESEKVEIVEISRAVPSDFKSKAMWLASRQKDIWGQDKNVNEEEMTQPILTNNPLADDTADDSTQED